MGVIGLMIEKGIAALELEMSDSVPRTEYSVFMHNKLVKAVTGMENCVEAQRVFAEKWDICLSWNTMVGASFLGKYVTSMGHSEYAESGADRNDNVFTCFKDEDEVFAFDPFEKLPYYTHDEMVRMFDENYDGQSRWLPDTVTMTGTYITVVSGLIDMLGWDMLLSCAGYDPQKFGQFTDRYAQWMERFYIALADSKAPVVMVHDDIVWTEGAFMHPEWYRKYVFPNYKKYFSHLHEKGKKILFTSDGNYNEFIDDIAECGVNGFVLEPLTDMQYIADKYGKTHSFIGNADTLKLLYGDKEAIYNEVKRCMDIGKKYPGFIMAVGNHIPPNTPVDNCLYYDEWCKKLGKR